MKFYEMTFNHGFSNEETVNAVDLDGLIDNLGEVSVDNVKIAGIQVYYMGREEGLYELFLEKSKNCVRRTEKFADYSGCNDELFDTLRQAQDVYYGAAFERSVELFALLVKEIEKAIDYESGISAWDSDARIRAFVGYNYSGVTEYLTTANAVITPIMLAVLKYFENDGRGYDEYWRRLELADLTDTSDLEERNAELKCELDWDDEDDEWDEEEYWDEEED